MNANNTSGSLGEMELVQLVNSPDEPSLVERARHDPEAFAELYRRHYAGIFRYCLHRLFERATAEDVTAATFLKIVQHLEGFRGDERAFRNWAFRIATNEINNHLRNGSRQNELLERFASECASQTATASPPPGNNPPLGWVQLQRALGTLKPRDQTIITLHFTEDMKLEEIADVLGSSPGTVRSQLSRALRKLRAKLSLRSETETLD